MSLPPEFSVFQFVSRMEISRVNETPERESPVVSSKVEIPSVWQWQESQDSYSDINQDFNFVSFLRHYRKSFV